MATGPGVTVTAVEVGKMIFEDTRLSANRNQSCATCHAASAGFADPDVSKANPVSEGSIAGKFGDRNAPPSAYAKFAPAFEQIMDPVRGLIYAGGQFLDGRRDTLEQQAKDPFLNPVEMANPNKQAVVDKVQNGPYADQFMAVYGSNVFTDTDTAFDRIAEAIAAFERSDEMNPFNSRFDCFQKDPVQYPLDTQEQMGLNVFQGKGKCANCHTLDTDPVSGKILFTNFQYFNIGVPANPDNPANKANAGFVDFGLGGRLGAPAENGKFKTPTLRNIEKTSPYMHNGVFDTLTEVVEFYNIEEKEFASPPPEVINDINPDVDFLDLNSQQIEALVAFLKTLTDGTGLCF
ncbi:MAG TPA: c-type cytochrome [Chromatiales bacterium]|nr:c-type cytochrome [Chromatiales bacterium]